MKKSERIRKARLDAGLTLEELAEKCGTIRQTISKYEQGIVTNIPTDRIEMIADATGVTPGWLVGWEKEDAQLVREAEALADAAHDRELMDAIIKIQEMPKSKKDRIYGYIDALYHAED